MFMNIWATAARFMLILLAAMQDVPGPIYEAAELDGAGPVRQFFQITIPLTRRAIFLVVLLGTIMTILDSTIVNIAVPTLQTDLHAGSYSDNSRRACVDSRSCKVDRRGEPVEVGSGLIKLPVTDIPGKVQNDIRTYLVDHPANGTRIE